MKIRIYLSIVLLFALSNLLKAQGEAALPSLLLPPSPALNSMGAVGTSLPSSDPFALYYNPAQLGFMTDINLAVHSFPSYSKWTPVLDLKMFNYAFTLKYDLRKAGINIPLSAGAGFLRSKFSFGNFVYTASGSPEPLGTFESYDAYNAISAGLSLDYDIRFGIGLTYKFIKSVLAEFPDDPDKGKLEASAIDYGFLVSIPVMKLISDNYSFNFFGDTDLYPYLDFSLGGAVQNSGDEIYYIDIAQSDPLPRNARLGYSFSAGIEGYIQGNRFRFLGIQTAIEAEDLLIKKDSSKLEYQNFPGDIGLFGNVLGAKGDLNVVIHKGISVEIFETLGINFGSVNGKNIFHKKTSGFGIRTKGIFKLIKLNTTDRTIAFICDHFDLQYYNTTYFSSFNYEPKMEGIALIVTGLW